MASPTTSLITSPMQRIPIQTPRAVLRRERGAGPWGFALMGGAALGMSVVAILLMIFNVSIMGIGWPTLTLVVFLKGLAIVGAVSGAGVWSQFRRRALLRDGKLVVGTVVWRRGTTARIKVRLEDGGCVEFGQRVRDSRRLGPLEPGSPIGVLIDPARPGRALAPSLLGVVFVPVVDRRPAELSASCAAHSLPERPLEASLRAHWRGPKVGSVRLLGDALVWQNGGASVELPLSAPFRMDVSAWLMTPDCVALNVSIRSAAMSPTAPPVGFSVALPQSQVSLLMPLRQARLPFVDAAGFERLWPALLLLASAQGVHVPPWVAVDRATPMASLQSGVGPR